MIINNNTIIKDDNQLIREKSVDVKLPLTKEDEQIILDMYKYVFNSTIEEIATKENLRPAVGISAIQVGINKKITVVVLKDENGKEEIKYALINPKIVSESIEKTCLKSGEGCLSVKDDHQGYIYRANKIKVKAFDYFENKEILIQAKGYLAIVLQHELDHFKGVLYYDHINKNNPFEIKQNAIIIE